MKALKMQQLRKQKLQEMGGKVDDEMKTMWKEQLSSFKTNLEEFALKHRDDLRYNATFRKDFLNMCKEVGVDPLASKEGMWGKVFGKNMHNFYYILAIRVINICLALRKKNGGFLEIHECLHYLRATKLHGKKKIEDSEITIEDVRKAVKTLKVLGKGFDIVTTGGKTLICSVPVELSEDSSIILKAAEEKGYVTRTSMKSSLEGMRFEKAINQLIEKGICWIDKGLGADGKEAEPQLIYWFPSLYTSLLADQESESQFGDDMDMELLEDRDLDLQ